MSCNYLMAKTSPYLSGQCKLDVYLKPTERGTLTDEDVELSPLGENRIFCFWPDKRRVLNYTHGENIRALYLKVGERFWDDTPECQTPHLINNIDLESFVQFETPDWWAVNEKNKTLSRYDHTYRSGVRRVISDVETKQLSCLVPLWIEDPKVGEELEFRIVIKDLPNFNDESIPVSQSYRTIISKKIVFGEELQAYLKEWWSHTSDEVMNVDFSTDTAYVKGFSVTESKVVVEPQEDLLIDLLWRERPMMEVDNMLTQSYKTSNMVAPQLLNMNFVFDLTDILPALTFNMMLNKQVIIGVEVYKGNGEKLEAMDLYSNYTEMYKWDTATDNWKEDTNIYDYLNDYQDSDLICANKLTQPIFHWALVENPEYIFNLYDGCSPVVGDAQTSGLYFAQPNLSISPYNSEFNNIGWCRHIKCTFDELSSVRDENYTVFGPFNGTAEVGWYNNVKYNIKNIVVDRFEEGFRLLLAQVDVLPSSIPDWTVLGNDVWMKGDSHNYIIVSTDLNKLTFGGLYDIIRGNESSAFIGFLRKLMERYLPPTELHFNRSLNPIRIASPKYNSKESAYDRLDTCFHNVLWRYNGKIRPAFIPVPDYINDYIDGPVQNTHQVRHNNEYCLAARNSQDNVVTKYKPQNRDHGFVEEVTTLPYETYIKYLREGFSPSFPSIGFYNIAVIVSTNWNVVEWFGNPEIEEYPWGANSIIKVLPVVFKKEFTKSQIDNRIKQQLGSTTGTVEDAIKAYNKEHNCNITYESALDWFIKIWVPSQEGGYYIGRYNTAFHFKYVSEDSTEIIYYLEYTLK